MKLYYAPGACSLATHIALAEAGADYSLDKVDLQAKKTDEGGDFNAVAPKGKVPVLEMDNGETLTENAVILDYVADKTGKLAPKAGSSERLRLQEWLNYIATELHKGFSPLFNKALSDDTKQVFRTNLVKQLNYVEGKLGGDYLTGSTFTIADGYLFTMLRWAKATGVEFGPKLAAYFDRVAARAGVKRAMQEEGLNG
ncbi:MAG: glutathione transferase GstA, partial [Hyphomicrobiales bacterium]|nr:glutathione transferase GstA [Hyphomicrobiales bacterium]